MDTLLRVLAWAIKTAATQKRVEEDGLEIRSRLITKSLLVTYYTWTSGRMEATVFQGASVLKMRKTPFGHWKLSIY